MLYTILAAIAVLLIFLALFITIQPATFRIARAISIAAPPGVVFDHVNDFHNWDAWSPWAKLDPGAKTSFEGPTSGSGAAFGWSGNKAVGEGRMKIIESVPDEHLRIQLDFVRPFKGTNNAEFTFQPEENGTRVTWTMTGTRNFMAKAFGLIVNCDKMIGNQFEQGLSQLKTVVEDGATGQARTLRSTSASG